jgi:hypothetical protein
LLPVFPGLSDAVVRFFIPLPRLGIPSFYGFGMNLLILGKGGYQLGSCFLELVHNDSKRIMLSFVRKRLSGLRPFEARSDSVLVRLAKKVVQIPHARYSVPMSVRHIRHAA